ncbi:MAG TPA: flagellar basal body-associated FliL family protein [Proteobacteria bacterium]|nr:flagellar basal body-associated FliL family protein [Pseudomonadota bacterium]
MVDEKGQALETDEEIAPPKKKPIFLLIAIGAAAAIGIAGAVFGIVKASGKKANPQAAAAEVSAGSGETGSAQGGMVEMGPTYKLENLLLNLADLDERRYLRVTIELELYNKELVPEVEKRLPKIRDALILLLSSKTAAELQTPEGQVMLRQQIAKRLSSILGQGTVKDVYLTQFLIQ